MHNRETPNLHALIMREEWMQIVFDKVEIFWMTYNLAKEKFIISIRKGYVSVAAVAKYR